ncbi:MAG: SH3 domain-containing protein [Clostridia bacterium]|nr:SH3 domain-containing protein [Clostridia bacterium]
MKKTFYMLWVLLLCIPAVSVRAEKSTVWNYTRLYRQTLLDTNSICGVIFLGYIDGSANDRDCLKQVLYDEGNMNEFPFLSDIPDEHIVEIEYGSELYCIFPSDQNASVAVNEYVYDGPDDYLGRTGNVLYRSEYGDPIILRCNASDIIRDTEITVVDSQGNVLVWQPGLNLNDGSVDVPWEEPYVYDMTYRNQANGDTNGKFGLSVMQVVNCQEWVSLRQEPDVNSTCVDRVPLGTILRNCFRASEKFYYVEYNGLSGYVHGDYLKELPSLQGKTGSEYPNRENGYLFGMEGEWETDVLVQENGTDMVYTLQFLTDESGVEGELVFSFDDPWSNGVSTWSGTYFAYNPAEYTCGTYMFFLDTPDGQRSGEIYVVLEDNTLTITDVSGDAFWPFTSGSTETLRFYPY